MPSDLSIKRLNQEKIEDALNLVWKVFLEYEASDYTREGIDAFYQSIHDEGYLSALSVHGAFSKEIGGDIPRSSCKQEKSRGSAAGLLISSFNTA